MHVSTGARRGGSAVLALLPLLIGVLLAAAPASASAVLARTDPAANSVLHRAPKLVTLTFSEAVSLPAEDAIMVHAPDGSRVEAGRSEHAGSDRATVRVALRGTLPAGTYLVMWKAITAQGHPIEGMFTFAVKGAAESRSVGLLYGASRWVGYAGYALLVGAAAAVLLRRPRTAGRRPLQRLLLGGWSALLVSAVAGLLLLGPHEAQTGLAAAWDLSTLQHTVGTTTGTALAVRLLLLAPAGAFLALLHLEQGAAGGPDRPGRWRIAMTVAGAMLAAALAGTWA